MNIVTQNYLVMKCQQSVSLFVQLYEQRVISEKALHPSQRNALEVQIMNEIVCLPSR